MTETHGFPNTHRVAKRKRLSNVSRGPLIKSEDSDDDDVPLSKRIGLCRASDSMIGPRRSESVRRSNTTATSHQESDSDIPLAKISTKRSKQIQETPSRSSGQRYSHIKKENGMEDKKLATKIQSTKIPEQAAQLGMSRPAPHKQANRGMEAALEKLKGSNQDKNEDEDGSPGEMWWEYSNGDDRTRKWTTLEHNGVLFPPPYTPLPLDVKMKYDGVPITLEPEAEEVACFFGEMLNATHYTENATFQKNFFQDFQMTIKRTSGGRNSQGQKAEIREFDKCDFSPIFEYFQSRKSERKELPLAERKAQKAGKDSMEGAYKYCVWDGKKQKVGNFRIEPPGLFRGRGDHPKNGRVKTRVHPEQVTLNLSRDAKVPAAPAGHQWKEVKHDQEATWLAMWNENVNGRFKYVMLAASSDVKGQSDFHKFETARRLKIHIDRIRNDYQQDLQHRFMATRQLATAVYLVDKLALRAGNEKGEGEADTVGCCSLKYENITLRPPNTVIFDFLGKDSIRFYDKAEVDAQVFKNLKIFKKHPKKEGDSIFDRLTTAGLNRHLSTYMPGLSAKVFRTFNASHTFSELLKSIQPGGSIDEKVKAYNDANRTVAILCNHKRTISSNHLAQMEKLQDRAKVIRYQQWRLKQQMLSLDPTIRNEMEGEFFELDRCLDLGWIAAYQLSLLEDKRQRAKKKFEADKPSLDKELELIAQTEREFQQENTTGKVKCSSKSTSIEKLQKDIIKAQQRLEAATLQIQDKESNKEIALGTSKTNYIDPRLTVVFSKRFGVPINKLFSKSLQEKFDWALKSADETWEF
ncbi:hypothetical protein ABOM_000743 [Aspergillus bombycis]|uniref:DNA topoisomerase I n=1 Tax=Aspergillus bombycis TaxID=109264 RepID=A0A1F8AH83_9EURO|nr:hypothetical protein ABOM_000743 [Aspergillus bombycis]OGM50779.1 hypothetical protein ABOM_000743 [Aspergillus bombycis]